MLLDSLSNIPPKIFNFFNEETERLAKEHRFKKRTSKVTPSVFITGLTACALSQQFSLNTLASFLKERDVEITKQSLHERFNLDTVSFVKTLSTSFLNHFKTKKLPQLHGLEQFSALNIIDSSSVSLHKALSELFKGSGGNASNAALKIQLMFDYLHGQIKEVTLTPGCKNDQGFDHYFSTIQSGALYLMDLGYFKLSSFKKIIDGNAFFVSRLLTGTKLFTTDKQPFDLLQNLSHSGSFITQSLLMGAHHKIPIRLVAQRIPKEMADRRRQRLIKDHKRRGKTPCKESLALQEWSIYITNTTQEQISAEHLHQTYALRWQIELFFKLSKSLMNIDVINSTQPPRVVIETYSKFIAMMLLFLLCNPVRMQNGKELSFYKACKLLTQRSMELLKAFKSVYHLKNFIHSFHEVLARFAVKEVKKKSFSTLEFTADECFNP